MLWTVGAVNPPTTIITRLGDGCVVSPVCLFILENKTFGNRAYCTQNEGLGKFCATAGWGGEVYAHLKWMEPFFAV